MTRTRRPIGPDERRARIGVRHRLAVASRGATPEDVAASLVALHATDAATVYLSVGARMAEPAVDPIERALYEDRTLTRMHGMRQTIFVMPTALAPVVQSSTTREMAAKERASLLKTAAAAGFSPAWITAVEDQTLAALHERGTATGGELAKAVPGLREQGIYARGTASEAKVAFSSLILRRMGFDGRIVRGRPQGSWTSSQFRWAVADGHPEVPVEEAKAELARRWLAAYGPGTEADLKWWTGWKVTDVRRALASIGAVEVSLAAGVGYVMPADEEPVAAPEPWAALLPGLDPTPMGWQGRDWFLAGEHVPELFDRSGNIGPTVWWNGEIIGGWAHRADGSVGLRLFADHGREAAAAVEAEVQRWQGWVGQTRITPRFRTPLERELAGGA